MGYDAEATRRRILSSATAEFAAHGLAGARIERIATEARANKQAIYLYFGGKRGLFGAVLRTKMDEVCRAGVDPDDVSVTVGELFDWYQENPELIRLLLWEALEVDDVENEPERRAEYRANVAALRAGGFADDLPEPCATAAVQDWLFTIVGLVAWNFAVPQLCRLVLDEEDDAAALARRRATVMSTARLLARARDSV
ncbi:TetR/AcrR family transcriptional regulator [Actinomadura roseirufa]|uniref:TetR/AcrR family transcriptional regulator n=1 Tax=Actinomadura roseirufa TaxID=2094049 RepID=UPI001040FFCC|nr:TetR/AcrR family transcriptional regulator [Actinomadura roseirufa]